LNAPTSVLHNSPDWALLARDVADGDSAGFARFYEAMSGIRRYLFATAGPQDAEDLYHETIVDAVIQIRRGDLRDSGRLQAYVRGIAIMKLRNYIGGVVTRRQVASIDDQFGLHDAVPSPESCSIQHEHRAIMERILRTLPERDREVLIRFYLKEEDAEKIQSDLGLTQTQFRLIKSRAKQRFAALTQARLARKPCRSIRDVVSTIPLTASASDAPAVETARRPAAGFR